MVKKPILRAVLVILLVNIACGSSGSLPPATNLPPTKPVSGKVTGSDQSDSNGQVQFQDSASNNILTVTLKDDDTSTPVKGIEVSFISNGTQVLVIAHDPSNQYADVIQELQYSELSLQNSSAGKLAAPKKQISLAAVLLLVKIVNLYQDFTEWKAFLQDFPDIEKWSTEAVQLCVTPEQARQGLGLVTDTLIGFVTQGLFGKEQIEIAFKEIFDELAQERAGDILDGYASTQTPSIMRFTVFSIQDGFPKFLRVDGFCLDPFNKYSADSALDWLLYGINNQNIYPFEILTKEDFSGYTNYIEGGDPISRDQFLSDLKKRLPSSSPTCIGYSSDSTSLQVWTKDWSPAWEMNQLCYVGCETLNPPYQSTSAGFFLSGYEGEWKLAVNYVNEPENYYFGDYELTACDGSGIVSLSQTDSSNNSSTNSCPGAPPQRLKINEMAYVCTAADTVKLREGPGRNYSVIKSLVPGADLKVIGGPSCSDNWSWWQVETEAGYTGWISEGGDNVDPYFICPQQ